MPQRMADFFAMEAGEYLERLDGLVSPAGAPSVEELVRLARALRGSALMANQQPIAGAAAGLEALARALRESRVAWDAGTRQIAIRAVDDLKILVRSVSAWTPREDAKARAVAQELEQAAGIRASTRMAAMNLADAGTRAFASREGAALASALDRAAMTLAQNPAAVDQVQGVLKVMQPLRGLAGLADLPPLPDVLDGIQRAVAELTRRKSAGPFAASVFRAASKALARAAREATSGSPATESPELTEFAAELGKLFDTEKDVVSMESLYFADQGPHVVQEGAAPGGSGANPEVELVSHGDHLRQVADALDRATSDAQRTLRVQSLSDTLTALASAGFASVVQAIRDAVTRGAAQREPATFAARLREVGTLLSDSAQAGTAALIGQLDRIAAGLRSIAPSAPAAPTRPPVAPGRPPVAPAKATAGPAPNGDDSAPGLIGSLLRFHRYVEALGSRPPSLEELLAGPPVLPVEGSPGVGADAVPIETICFTGPAALQRALSLRDQVRAALAKGDGGSEVSELLEEIFDLVQLGQHN